MTDPPLTPVDHPPRRPWAAWAIVATVVVAFVGTGLRGLDFGRHWDEPLLLTSLKASLDNRLLLPTGICNYDVPVLKGGDYEYPTFLYWVLVGSAAPELLTDPAGLGPPSTAFVQTRAFGLRVRRNCLLLSSLAIVWTYAAARRVARRPVVAAAAAAAVGTSWEVAYHARYIATDAILMQWAALCLALCLTAVTTAGGGRRRWLLAAAVVAGLATGTKYPGGLLAVPVGAAAWAGRDRRWPAFAAKLLGAQVGVFLLVTPGAVLQPWNFLAWVRFDRYHYGTLGHLGHTIRGPVPHLMAMGEYLSLAFFSRVPAVAATVFVAAIVGGGLLVRRRRWAVAIVAGGFPLLYVGYFAGQVAMLVRNLLVLGPFLAVLAAVALDRWADRTATHPWGRWATAAVVAVGLAVNLRWLGVAAAAADRRDGPAAQLERARAYLADHPEWAVYPTEVVASLTGLPLVPTGGTRPAVLAFSREDGDAARWPANVRGLVEQTFGSLAYNPDYAPDWMENAVLLIDLDGPAAAARRCPVDQVERAVARHDAAVGTAAGYRPGPLLTATSPGPAAVAGVALGVADGRATHFYQAAGVPAPDAADAWVGGDDLTAVAAGLDPAAAYRVGWSWWDFGVPPGGRVESVDAESTDGRTRVRLCGPTPLPPWPLPQSVGQDHPTRWPPPPPPTPAGGRVCVPLPPAVYRDGRFRLVFHRVAGPDVSVTSVWIEVGQR